MLPLQLRRKALGYCNSIKMFSKVLYIKNKSTKSNHTLFFSTKMMISICDDSYIYNNNIYSQDAISQDFNTNESQ